jgi:DNA invertase Pin-like site-specific DNA recombinase
MKTIAYIRVSTIKQDLDNQRLEIEKYCSTHGVGVDKWIEIEISSRKSLKERLIDKLMDSVRPGDTIIVSELSRLGRSISEVVEIVNGLIKKKVKLIAIKQGITVNGKHDMSGKIIITMFALMAEIERDIISERTKMGLGRARAQGVKLGNPSIDRINNKRVRDADRFARSVKAEMQSMRERGLSQRGMVRELNDGGVKAHNGGTWSLRQVQKVLERMA